MKGGLRLGALATRLRGDVCGLIVAAAGISSTGCSVVAGLGEFDNAAAAESVGAASEDSGSSVEPAPTQAPSGAGEGKPVPGPTSPGGAGMPPRHLDGGAGPHDASSGLGDGTSRQDAEMGGSNLDANPGAADARPDAPGSAYGGDAGGWCASHASSTTIDCHDFDDGKPPQTGFSNHYYSGHFATVTSADFAPGSPPSALLLSTPALDAGAPSQDEQFNDILSFHAKVELSFALKIVDYDPNAGYVSLFRASYRDGTWAVEIDLHGSGASFVESTKLADGGTGHATYAAALPAALDAWTDVDCVFDFANHTISLSYNGIPVVSGQPMKNPDPNGQEIFIQTGLNYLVAPAKPMTIYYDNILLGAPP